MSDAEDLSSETTRTISFTLNFEADTPLDREEFIDHVRNTFSELVSSFTHEDEHEARHHFSLGWCDIVPKSHFVTITIRAKGPDAASIRRVTRRAMDGFSWCNSLFSYQDQEIESIVEVPPRPEPSVSDAPTGGLGAHIRAIVGDPVPAGSVHDAEGDAVDDIPF